MGLDLKIVLIGGRTEIEFVEKRIVYPQLLSGKYIWSEELFRNGSADFLENIDVAVLAFEAWALSNKVRSIIEDVNKDRDIVVIDFYSMRTSLSPQMNADYVMRNPAVDSFEGLIMGISHGEVGIIPQRLGSGKYANLAVSSQDLYYNYKTLEYCIQNYHDKVKNIQTVVLDMYDYSYFNYDVSLSTQLPLYLGFGGFNKDQHNFEHNRNYSGVTFDSIVRMAIEEHLSGINREVADVWEMLFGSDIYHCFDPETMTPRNLKLRAEMVTDEACSEFSLRSIANKAFDNTVSENVLILRQMLELMHSVNPDIKVYLVTIPRYEGAWTGEEAMVRNWKSRFMDIINELQKDYPFEYFDLSRHEIATCRAYYNDASHFNCYGAMKFTDLLNDIMQAH